MYPPTVLVEEKLTLIYHALQPFTPHLLHRELQSAAVFLWQQIAAYMVKQCLTVGLVKVQQLSDLAPEEGPHQRHAAVQECIGIYHVDFLEADWVRLLRIRHVLSHGGQGDAGEVAHRYVCHVEDGHLAHCVRALTCHAHIRHHEESLQRFSIVEFVRVVVAQSVDEHLVLLRC